MSDSCHRQPLNLPPYEDGFGQLWTFDGVCLNRPPEPEPDFLNEWPEDLQWIAFTAAVNMELRDRYFQALDELGGG